MTNNLIIFQESLKLAEAGKIKFTGRTIMVDLPTGRKEFPEPEELHTYATWKKLGRQVKRGEKSFPICIWKYAEKKAKDDAGNVQKDENGDEITSSSMFMKKSFFFTFEQTEELKPKK